MADVGNLVAKLTLNTEGFDKAISGVTGTVGKLATGITNTLTGVTAAVGAAVAGAAAGMGAIIHDSVKNFAEYEQLVGGVETLFKNSAGIVEDYAKDAYKTAGISANEYMQQATNFSAALIKSLSGDTKQAAHVTDMAIKDMADNSNKMGTALESIQTAYQGFAKQNYTMLDNLKLGYGGTKTEMERLLKDAQKLSGIKYDISNLNDVFQAIHVIQEEMGITGTTALEASTTISGSLAMVKASWQDLLTSLSGGGEEIDTTINNLVESVETFLTNVIPVIEKALYGFGNLIMQLAPIIAERLPDLISTLVPMIIETAVYIVNALVENLPLLINVLAVSLIENLPLLVTAIINTLDVLLTSLLPTLFEIAVQLLLAVMSGLLDNMDMLMDAITTLVESAITIILENLPKFLELGVQIILKIIEGILLAIPRLIGAIGKVLGIFDDGAEDIKTKSENVVTSIETSSRQFEHTLTQTANVVSTTSQSISNSAEDANKSFADSYREMIMTSNGFKKSMDDANTWVKESEVKIYDANGNIIDSFTDVTRTITDKTDEMSNQTQMTWKEYLATVQGTSDGVNNSVDNMAHEVDSAASDIESSCDRINAAFASISGPSGGSISIGTRASGGPVSLGSSYLVGEQGPELFVPRSDGYIVNAERTAGIMSGNDSEATYEEALKNFFRVYLEPFMMEITANTKVTADKPNVTTVKIGQQDIVNAYDSQKRANGYSFVG